MAVHTFVLHVADSEYKNVYDLYAYPAGTVVEVKTCLDTGGGR